MKWNGIKDELKESSISWFSSLALVYLIIWIVTAVIIGVTALNNIALFEAWNDDLCTLAFGGLGGAVASSRVVVRSIRHNDYQPSRLPWQIVTPIYSSVFGWISMIGMRGGVLAFTNPNGSTLNVDLYYAAFIAFLLGDSV